MNRHFIDLIPSSLSRTKLFILTMGCLLPLFVFSQEAITENLKNVEIEKVKDGLIVYGMNEDATEFRAIKYDQSLKKIKSYSKTFSNKTRFSKNSPYYISFYTKGEREITTMSLNGAQDPLSNYEIKPDSIHRPVEPDWEKINSAVVYDKFLKSTKNKSWFILIDSAKQRYNNTLYCFANDSGNILYQQTLNESDELFSYSSYFFDSITENIIIAGNYSVAKKNNKLFSMHNAPIKADPADAEGTVCIGITAEGKIYSRKKYSFPEHISKIDLSIKNSNEQFSIIHHIIKENSNYIVIAENVRKKIAKGGVTDGGYQYGGNYNAGPSTYVKGAGPFWASMGFSIMKLNDSLDVLDSKIFTCECHSDNSYNNSEVVFKNYGFYINVRESLLSDFTFNRNTQQGLILYSVVRYSNDQKSYYAIALNGVNSTKYSLESGSKKDKVQYFIKDEKSVFKFSVNSKEGTYTLEVVPVM